MSNNSDIILSLQNITKVYPGVIALKDVSVEFKRGEIHALVGENGAGKSTLIKTITGNITPEMGTITYNGQVYSHGITPTQSRENGIEAIYQEFNLVDALTAAENICMGRKYGKLINQKAMNEAAQAIFDRFNIEIDPKTPVRDLSSGKRQIVEIAKAISKDARLLIMDEPTAPLSNAEIAVLMEIIRQLKAEGVTILYISHRLDEIFQIADRVSVFRDGQFIKTLMTSETNRRELIALMVGRELSDTYPKRLTPAGEVALEVENLAGNGVQGVSFGVRRGTILGIAGLVGSGRSEIMKVIYGAEEKQAGEIRVNGKVVNIRNPKDAQDLGIGLVPEDRKREGCLLMESVKKNIGFNTIGKISKGIAYNKKRLDEIANYYYETLRIKVPNLETKVLTLSGGNQQKVVIAKTLAANADILIFDEPTRGIDVGAKHEIYELMNQLCSEGKAIIMVTSDMEELLGMSDRIIVFHEKRMAGEVPIEMFNQEYILYLASGGKQMTREEYERENKVKQ